MSLLEPDDDRDEPTDDEIAEHIVSEPDMTDPMRGTGDRLTEAIRAREVYPDVTRGLHCCSITLKSGCTVLEFAAVLGHYAKGTREGAPKWVRSSKVTVTIPNNRTMP
jgi:hypothetical protein